MSGKQIHPPTVALSVIGNTQRLGGLGARDCGDSGPYAATESSLYNHSPPDSATSSGIPHTRFVES